MALAGKCTQHIAGAQKLALVGMEMKKKKPKPNQPRDDVVLDLLLHSHDPMEDFCGGK